MRIFKDKHGRTWTLKIDIEACRRMRDMAEFDLLKTRHSDEELEKLQEVSKFVDILFCICFPEIQIRQMTDRQFGESFTIENIQYAASIFDQEVADFFGIPAKVAGRINNRRLRKLRRKACGLRSSSLPEQLASILGD